MTEESPWSPHRSVSREKTVNLQATFIDDTFAEAFGMRYTRLIVTAHDQYWLDAAIRELTGYSSSVIACDAETGVERWLSAAETPDGRPGAAVLVFGFSEDALAKSVPNRAGQCVMTCPSTALYDGLPDTEKRLPLGKHIRFFGDGYQKSKKIGNRRYWRVPVMDGEFVVSDKIGVAKGVAGGNIIMQAIDKPTALDAARRAAESLRDVGGVITPFPGGIARSGSKVGSRYKGLPASTADAFCPTLKGRVETKLHPDANCAYELVIDGVDEAAVGNAMAVAMRAAVGEGVVAISAGNYGGKLGKFHFHLRPLLAESEG
ncbi:MAG: formylmethanofuran--tetrahydromethanopterin N-formyltransferase [Pirellulaceae bacterium]